jgi:hypothetical protein
MVIRLLLLFSLSLSFNAIGDSFSQRLSPFLAISGIRCLGGEMDAGFKCRFGEWLLYVDNINRCRDGWCTQVTVEPITVKLLKRIVDAQDAEEFRMLPTMPVRSEVRWILRRYFLQQDLSGYLNIRRLR